MIITFWYLLLGVVVSVTADAGREHPTKLDIKTTYLPDDCPETAKKGDYIHVHYVSFQLFDERTT